MSFLPLLFLSRVTVYGQDTAEKILEHEVRQKDPLGPDTKTDRMKRI